MESISIGDSVTDKIVRQLTEDSEAIQQILDYYQSERTETVKAQNLALAAYDAEIKAIEDSVHPHLRYRSLSSSCYWICFVFIHVSPASPQ
jgi:LytS/YehU family sensor histidine kinase